MARCRAFCRGNEAGAAQSLLDNFGQCCKSIEVPGGNQGPAIAVPLVDTHSDENFANRSSKSKAVCLPAFDPWVCRKRSMESPETDLQIASIGWKHRFGLLFKRIEGELKPNKMSRFARAKFKAYN